MTFRSLGTTTDCIIRVQEKEFLCHRIILSFASSFLKQILEEPYESCSAIILPDFSADVVKLVIGLMYTGECYVLRQQRQEFIQLCTLLQLKGIQDFADDAVELQTLVDAEGMVDEEGIDFIEHEQDDTNQHEATIEQTTFEHFEEVDDGQETDVQHANDPSMIFETPQFGVSSVGTPVTFTYGEVKRPAAVLGRPRLKLEPPEKKQRNLFESSRPGRPRVVRTQAGLEIEYSPNAPKPKVAIDAEQEEILRERLHQLIIKTYQHLGTHGQQALVVKDHKTRLVVRENLLMKGNFNCVLCEKEIAVVYTTDKKGKFKQWINSNMKRHMLRIHKDLHELQGDTRPLELYVG